MTYKEIRANEEVNALLDKGNKKEKAQQIEAAKQSKAAQK